MTLDSSPSTTSAPSDATTPSPRTRCSEACRLVLDGRGPGPDRARLRARAHPRHRRPHRRPPRPAVHPRGPPVPRRPPPRAWASSSRRLTASRSSTSWSPSMGRRAAAPHANVDDLASPAPRRDPALPRRAPRCVGERSLRRAGSPPLGQHAEGLHRLLRAYDGLRSVEAARPSGGDARRAPRRQRLRGRRRLLLIDWDTAARRRRARPLAPRTR